MKELSKNNDLKIKWYSNDILINELRVTSYYPYEVCLLHEVRVASYCLLHKLWVTLCIWVTSYCWVHGLRVTFFIRVTSCCLLHKLWVTFYIWVASCCLLHEFRVTFCIQVTSCCLWHKLLFWEFFVNMKNVSKI